MLISPLKNGRNCFISWVEESTTHLFGVLSWAVATSVLEWCLDCGLTVLTLQAVLKHLENAFPNLIVLKLFSSGDDASWPLDNAISDNGVESLSKSLKKRLQNGFPPLSLVDVSRALLSVFWLVVNNISHEGAIYIADMIMVSNGTMEVAFSSASCSQLLRTR